MPVVSALNQKGGVGKTSTCHHLSGTLDQMGLKVLLVDADPQSSLGQGFWGPVAAKGLDPSVTIAAIFAGERPYPEQVIHPTGVGRIDLIPGSRRAASYNVPDPHLADPELQGCLAEFLADVKGGYDLVLIDCPPNLHMASWAALAASDHLVVPLAPEDYASQGLSDVTDSLAMVRAHANPDVGLLGYLLTMVVPRRTIHQIYEDTLRGLYGSKVFEARVPEAVDYVEAIARRLPIATYKPKGAPAKAIRAVADELLARIAAADAIPATEAA